MPDDPVLPIPVDEPDRKPEPGVGLCLSGGGYRAMLFHLGALWRLYESGLLPKVNRISSVSGGSITAGVLALRWNTLSFDPARVQSDFVPGVVQPLRLLASETLDAERSSSASPFPGGSAIGWRRPMKTICLAKRLCRISPTSRAS
jgi:NTE family protein